MADGALGLRPSGELLLSPADQPLSPQWKFARAPSTSLEARSALIGPWDGTGAAPNPSPGGGAAAPAAAKAPWRPADGKTAPRTDKWVPSAVVGATGGTDYGRPGQSPVGSLTAAPTNRWGRGGEESHAPIGPGGASRWGNDEPVDGHTRWGQERPAAGPVGVAGRGRGSRAEPDRWPGPKERDGWLPGMPAPGEAHHHDGGGAQLPGLGHRWEGAPASGNATGGTDRWRGPGANHETLAVAAGRGRGFAVGRGRSLKALSPGAPGAPVMASHSPFSERHDGVRYAPPAGAASPGGGNNGGNAGEARHGGGGSGGQRYSTNYMQLLHAHMRERGGIVAPEIPATADYPELLTGSEVHDNGAPHQHFSSGGTFSAAASGASFSGDSAMSTVPQAAPPVAAPTVSPQAFAADSWVYRDPQGVLQGPFAQKDILEWFEAGFFPQDLPIKSSVDLPEVPFLPLTSMMKMWAHIGAGRALPPGFVASGQVQAPAPAPAPQVAAAPSLRQTSLLEQLGHKLEGQDSPTARAGTSVAGPLAPQPSQDLPQPQFDLSAAQIAQQQQQQQQQQPLFPATAGARGSGAFGSPASSQFAEATLPAGPQRSGPSAEALWGTPLASFAGSSAGDGVGHSAGSLLQQAAAAAPPPLTDRFSFTWASDSDQPRPQVNSIFEPLHQHGSEPLSTLHQQQQLPLTPLHQQQQPSRLGGLVGASSYDSPQSTSASSFANGLSGGGSFAGGAYNPLLPHLGMRAPGPTQDYGQQQQEHSLQPPHPLQQQQQQQQYVHQHQQHYTTQQQFAPQQQGGYSAFLLPPPQHQQPLEQQPHSSLWGGFGQGQAALQQQPQPQEQLRQQQEQQHKQQLQHLQQQQDQQQQIVHHHSHHAPLSGSVTSSALATAAVAAAASDQQQAHQQQAQQQQQQAARTVPAMQPYVPVGAGVSAFQPASLTPTPATAAAEAPRGWGSAAAPLASGQSLADIQREQAAAAAAVAGRAGSAAPSPGPAASMSMLDAGPHAVVPQQGGSLASAQTDADTEATAEASSSDSPGGRRGRKVKAAQTSSPPAEAVASTPSPPPESAVPAKPSPWAAPVAKLASGSLLAIQQEEQAKAAAEAARAAEAAARGASAVGASDTDGWAKPEAPLSAWAKIAAANAGKTPPGWPPAAAAPPPPAAAPLPPAATTGGTSMARILAEESARVAALKAAGKDAPAEGPVGFGPGPRATTLGDLLHRQLAGPAQPAGKGPVWGSGSGKGVPSLREVMQNEECAADLEGGNVDDSDIAELIAMAQLRHNGAGVIAAPLPLPSQRVVPQANGAAAGWTVVTPPAGSAQPPGPPAKTLRDIQEEERMRATAAATPTRQQAAVTKAASFPSPPVGGDDDMFWDYGGAPAAPAAPAPAAPARPVQPAVARPAGTTAAAVARAAATKPAPAASTPRGGWAGAAGAGLAAAAKPSAASKPAPAAKVNGHAAAAAAPQAGRPAAGGGAAGISAGPADDGLNISPEFREWCRSKTREFLGTDDLTLIVYLWSLASRSEVAETCQAYMANKPGVSTFVAEFLKRKDAELVRQNSKGKKKGGGGAAAVAAAATGPAVQQQPTPRAAGLGAEDWQEISAALPSAAPKGRGQGVAIGGRKGASAKGSIFAVLGNE